MYERNFQIAKYIVTFLVLNLIFKHSSILINVNIYSFEVFPLIFIPVAYLVINNLYIKDLERLKLKKDDYNKPIIIGFTIVNIILKMPLFYDVSIVIFLLLLKDKKTIREEETYKNITEYYSKHQKMNDKNNKNM